jgi:hypothetical protein
VRRGTQGTQVFEAFTYALSLARPVSAFNRQVISELKIAYLAYHHFAHQIDHPRSSADARRATELFSAGGLSWRLRVRDARTVRDAQGLARVSGRRATTPKSRPRLVEGRVLQVTTPPKRVGASLRRYPRLPWGAPAPAGVKVAYRQLGASNLVSRASSGRRRLVPLEQSSADEANAGRSTPGAGGREAQ